MTNLMKAVQNDDVSRVKTLVQAAYRGHTEIVRMLLEAGAAVTAVDPGMKATALHAAAYAGRTPQPC